MVPIYILKHIIHAHNLFLNFTFFIFSDKQKYEEFDGKLVFYD